MQVITSLLFTYSIEDTLNVPTVFLGEEELNIVIRHVFNYFKALRLKQ